MDLIAAAQGSSAAILRLKACYLVLSFHAKDPWKNRILVSRRQLR